MTKEELITKWDSFLKNIEQRFDDILEQAKTGTKQLIAQIEYDPVSISNAWNGIKGQLHSLTEKVAATWDEKMDDLFGSRNDVTSEERMLQYYKYYDLNHKMESKYDKECALALADAAQQIYENVMQHVNLNKIHNCKQCGTIMDIKIYSFMAKNVKCNSCGMVNSYEPDARILALEHFAVIPLANKEVISMVQKEADIQHQLHKLDHRIPEQKDKIQQFRTTLITTKKERTNQFYDFIVKNIPDKLDFYNRKREERLKWAEEV